MVNAADIVFHERTNLRSENQTTHVLIKIEILGREIIVAETEMLGKPLDVGGFESWSNCFAAVGACGAVDLMGYIFE